MRPHFIAVLTVLALCRMILPVQAQQRGPIIDMHVHANPDRSVQRVVAVMDEFHVVKAFLSNSLENVYRWTAAAPGRFIPSLQFPRRGGFPNIDSLRAEYVAGRLQGLGEITSQYWGISPNAPSLQPYFALAEELDIPVLIHTLGAGGRRPTFRLSAGHPLLYGGGTGPPPETPNLSGGCGLSISSRDDRFDVPISPGLCRPIDHYSGCAARGLSRLPPRPCPRRLRRAADVRDR